MLWQNELNKTFKNVLNYFDQITFQRFRNVHAYENLYIVISISGLKSATKKKLFTSRDNLVWSECNIVPNNSFPDLNIETKFPTSGWISVNPGCPLITSTEHENNVTTTANGVILTGGSSDTAQTTSEAGRRALGLNSVATRTASKQPLRYPHHYIFFNTHTSFGKVLHNLIYNQWKREFHCLYKCLF